MNDAKIKVTYRGWPGHFCCASYCGFRLNTLIEYDKIRVVVSTVGNMHSPINSYNKDGKSEEIGCGRYYETMVFRAKLVEGVYWDADICEQISLDGDWQVTVIDKYSDELAQKIHESAVSEIIDRIKSGDIVEDK